MVEVIARYSLWLSPALVLGIAAIEIRTRHRAGPTTGLGWPAGYRRSPRRRSTTGTTAVPKTGLAAALAERATTASGTAIPVPAIPTSGAASAPVTYCASPSSEDAAPARSGVVGERDGGGGGEDHPHRADHDQQRPDRKGSPSPLSTVTATATAPSRLIPSPRATTRTAQRRRASRPPSWLSAMMPSELAPNTKEKPCGERS